MQTPTASLGTIDPPKRRFLWAALIGVFCANVATVLGAILYGLTALREDLTAQILGFLVYVVLSTEGTLLLAGTAAGMLSDALFRRLGAVGGVLVGTVLLTILGGLVGFRYTWR